MNKEEVLTAYMNGDASQLYELRMRLRNKIKEIDTELKQRCNEIKKLIGRIAAKPQYQEDKTLKISTIVTSQAIPRQKDQYFCSCYYKKND